MFALNTVHLVGIQLYDCVFCKLQQKKDLQLNGVSYGNNTILKLQTEFKENAYSCLNMTVVLDLPMFDTLVDMLRAIDEDVSSVALDETWKLQRV